MEAETPKQKPARTRRQRLVRFMGWTVLLLVILAVGVALGVLGTLSALNKPTVAAAVSQGIRNETGLLVTYDRLQVAPLSGLHLEGLRVGTPPAFSVHAPVLARLEQLEVGWSVWPLLSGRIQVDPVRIQGLQVSLVADRAGGTSLDGLTAGPPELSEPETPEAPSEPSPLSGLLARALPAMQIQQVSLRDLRVELVEVADGQVVRRISAQGPELDASIRALGGALDMDLGLRGAKADGGVRVVVEDAPGTGAARKREAVLDLDVNLRTLDPQTIALTVGLAAVRQDLVERLPASGPLVKLEAEVSFDPAGRRTLVKVTEADLLQGAATAALDARLVEADSGAMAPQVDQLQADLDATRILEALEIELPGLELEGVSLMVRAERVGLAPGAGIPLRGTFSLNARIQRASLDRDGQQASVQGLVVDLKGKAGDEAGLELQASVGAEGLGAGQAAEGEGRDVVSAAGVKLDLQAQDLRLNPADPFASKGTLTVRGQMESVSADQSGRQAKLTGLGLEVETRLSGQLPLAGKLRLPIRRVSLKGDGLGQVELTGLVLAIQADELFPDFSSPTKAAFDLGLASLRLRRRGEQISAAGLRIRTTAELVNPQSFSASIQIPIQKLDLRQGKGLALGLRKLDLDLQVKDALIPAEAPARASAKLALRTRLGGLKASTAGIGAVGQQLGLELDLHIADGAPTKVEGAIPMGSVKVTRRPGNVRLAAVTKGRLSFGLDRLHFVAERPQASRARLRADLRAERIGLRPGTSFGLGSLTVKLNADGRRRRFDGKLGLALLSPRVDGRDVNAQPTLDLEADLDMAQPRGRLKLVAAGTRAPLVSLDGRVAFERSNGQLAWALKADLARLGLVVAFLPASVVAGHRLDWKRLQLGLDTKGALSGVVEGFRGLSPRIASEPLVSARGDLAFDLKLARLGYQRGELSLDLPSFDLALQGRRSQTGMDAELKVAAYKATVEMGTDRIDLTDLKQQVVVDTQGRIQTGRVRLTSSTALGRLDQTFVQGYPVADTRLEARIVVDRMASLRLEQLKLANPAGGTEFELLAAVDRLQDLVADLPAGRMAGRQALGLSGSLRQELSRIKVLGDDSRLSGRVTIPFRMESGDLEAFRLIARLEAENVGVELPAAGVSLAGFRGRIPVIEDLARKPDGSIQLLAGPPGNPYSRARFLDVHPFLKGEHFLAIERLDMLGQRIGPVAGNVRVSWGSLAVDQLQVAYKQGKITGQLAADYGGGKPRMFFKGNATGIRPSQSEDVLNANATLEFSPDPLDLKGRIQIVRIGKQHLLDVLDWIDPYQESVDVNRARLGLKVGFPKFLRIKMQDGFLSAKLELGGVAGVVRIDEIRGIALGPLLERYVAPVLK